MNQHWNILKITIIWYVYVINVYWLCWCHTVSKENNVNFALLFWWDCFTEISRFFLAPACIYYETILSSVYASLVKGRSEFLYYKGSCFSLSCFAIYGSTKWLILFLTSRGFIVSLFFLWMLFPNPLLRSPKYIDRRPVS